MIVFLRAVRIPKGIRVSTVESILECEKKEFAEKKMIIMLCAHFVYLHEIIKI